MIKQYSLKICTTSKGSCDGAVITVYVPYVHRGCGVGHEANALNLIPATIPYTYQISVFILIPSLFFFPCINSVEVLRETTGISLCHKSGADSNPHQERTLAPLRQDS